MIRSPDHLIVGGGIIGVAIADALAEAGASVTVIDKGGIGRGCSEGNAGWVTPCFAMPLPRPGLMLTAARWMMDPGSPFYVSPKPTPAMVRWMARFGRSMSKARFAAGTEALVGLSTYSLDAYGSADATLDGGIGLQRRGLLMLALTENGLESARADATMLDRLGVPGETLDPGGARRLEPALEGRFAGAVYYPNEAHLEPLNAVQAIADRAGRAGAVFLDGVEAFDFTVEAGRVTGVSTTQGPIRAGEVILATGSWSAPLARRLGLTLPLLGGKGYSMMVRPPRPHPRIPMMVLERKVAITPYGEELRLAGTLELVDGDDSISARRVASIREGAEAVLALRDVPAADRVWRGLRPCTPDGLPIIGRVPGFANLSVATGHQMLGIQTGPATGRLMADLLLDRIPAFDPAPFRAERFL